MWRTTPRQRSDRRLRLVVAGVAALGAGSIAVTLGDLLGAIGDPVPAPGWPGLGVYLLLLAGSGYVSVRVRVRSTWHVVTWTDTVILVGLVALPTGWVVLATATGILLTRLAKRSRPIKTAFAVGKESTVALAGGLVLAGLPGGLDGLTWTAVAWLVAAFAVMTVVDQLLAIPVLALASGTTFADRFRAHPDMWQLALVGRLGVALLAVLVLAERPQLVYALPLLVLLGHLWHEQWVRTREERQAWQRFAVATEAFADRGLDRSDRGLDRLLRHAVTSAAGLFSAEVCEVELDGLALARLVRGSGEAITYDGDAADAPPDPERRCVQQVALHGGPGQPELGALRLRFREQVRLCEREQAMLASYATALETAIRGVVAQPVGER